MCHLVPARSWPHVQIKLLWHILTMKNPGRFLHLCECIKASTPVRVDERDGLGKLLVVVHDILEVHICLLGLRRRLEVRLQAPVQQRILRPPAALGSPRPTFRSASQLERNSRQEH